jgi:hypothetical protein
MIVSNGKTTVAEGELRDFFGFSRAVFDKYEGFQEPSILDVYMNAEVAKCTRFLYEAAHYDIQ